MSVPRRLQSIAIVMAVAASVFVAAAHAGAGNVTYAGPKTWLPNYAQDGDYDNSADRWEQNGMYAKTCGGNSGCWARVTFIKSDGTWTYSYTDIRAATEVTIPSGQWNYQKKPYCLNNSSLTYGAFCSAFRN
jgi:hypothetical protein